MIDECDAALLWLPEIVRATTDPATKAFLATVQREARRPGWKPGRETANALEQLRLRFFAGIAAEVRA